MVGWIHGYSGWGLYGFQDPFWHLETLWCILARDKTALPARKSLCFSIDWQQNVVIRFYTHTRHTPTAYDITPYSIIYLYRYQSNLVMRIFSVRVFPVFPMVTKVLAGKALNTAGHFMQYSSLPSEDELFLNTLQQGMQVKGSVERMKKANINAQMTNNGRFLKQPPARQPNQDLSNLAYRLRVSWMKSR